MNISMTNLYVRKCEIDYLKFMGVDCLPNYIDPYVNCLLKIIWKQKIHLLLQHFLVMV